MTSSTEASTRNLAMLSSAEPVMIPLPAAQELITSSNTTTNSATQRQALMQNLWLART